MNPIKQLFTEYVNEDTQGYYTPKKILPYFDDSMLMMVIGARRIGKTDFALRLVCDLWNRFNLKSMWVRNKMTELKEPEFMNDFLNDAKRFNWCPEEWTVRPDGVHLSEDRDSECVIKFQSISTFSNRRGGAHPDVICMIFDELMPEDRRYPPMCATGLLSLTKSVFSGNPEARCLCFSNYVSVANPYFVKFRVYPDKNKDITFFKHKGILIERCSGYTCAIDHDNPWNRVYRSAQIGDYASETEDKLNDLICPIPKGATPKPYLVQSDNVLYRAWDKNGFLYWSEFKGPIDNKIVIWTPNLKECSDRVALIPPFMKKNLVDYMMMGTLRFKNPNVMFAILNIAFETV